MMQALSLRDIQLKELEILLSFSDFCKTNDLRFSLCGGTLLGAIRHKGFIPWDDDVDVSMPRGDYEKFIKKQDYFEEKTGLLICSQITSNLNQAPYLKVVNKKVITQSSGAIRKHFLWIDVIPVDEVPNDEKSRNKILKKMKICRDLLSIYTIKLSTPSKNPLKYAIRFFLKPLIMVPKFKDLICQYMINEATKYSGQSVQSVCAVTWGLYGKGEIIPKKSYLQQVNVVFEGYTFPTMSCWNDYLHNIYGDYMKLPPENQRKGHSLTAWVEKSK